MKNMKLLGSLLSSVTIFVALTSAAQSTETSVPIPTSSNRTCQQSVNSVGRELANKGAFIPFHPGGSWPRVEPTVSIENGNFPQNYRGYPINRPQQVEFILSGNDNSLLNVMSSPQFLTILASQIMAACPQVGMVNYQHWWADHVPVGYFADGTARAFSWVDYDDPRLGWWDDQGRLISRWGYYYSP